MLDFLDAPRHAADVELLLDWSPEEETASLRGARRSPVLLAGPGSPREHRYHPTSWVTCQGGKATVLAWLAESELFMKSDVLDAFTKQAATAAVKIEPDMVSALGLAVQEDPFASMRGKDPFASMLDAVSGRSKLDSVLGYMKEDPLTRVKVKDTF